MFSWLFVARNFCLYFVSVFLSVYDCGIQSPFISSTNFLKHRSNAMPDFHWLIFIKFQFYFFCQVHIISLGPCFFFPVMKRGLPTILSMCVAGDQIMIPSLYIKAEDFAPVHHEEYSSIVISLSQATTGCKHFYELFFFSPSLSFLKMIARWQTIRRGRAATGGGGRTDSCTVRDLREGTEGEPNQPGALLRISSI